MIKIDVLVALAVAVAVLTIFFLRAFANWRAGSRTRDYSTSLRADADRELERLQAEMEASRRTVEQDLSNGKE